MHAPLIIMVTVRKLIYVHFFLGDCNIPGNAILDYDINFVGIYSGNRALPTSLLGK